MRPPPRHAVRHCGLIPYDVRADMHRAGWRQLAVGCVEGP